MLYARGAAFQGFCCFCGSVLGALEVAAFPNSFRIRKSQPSLSILTRGDVDVCGSSQKDRLGTVLSANGSFSKESGSTLSEAAPSARSVAAHALAAGKALFPLQVLESDPNFRTMSDQRDRSFALLLVATVERHRGQIDKVIALCQKSGSDSRKQKRSKRKDDFHVQACLRLGTAQLLFLDVKEYAAVMETVQLLRSIPDCRIPEPKIKYVNAILRRIGREGKSLLEMHTALGDNIAPWMFDAWRQDWGDERADRMAETFMKQSHTDLSVNYPIGCVSRVEKHQVQERVQNAFGGDTCILPHGSIRVDPNVEGAVFEWPLYGDGAWWVQDASAALPALALYSTLEQQGKVDISQLHVVDLCAAPGGKTAQLVSLGFGGVTAIEMNERRSRRLVENLKRLGMLDRCETCVADGTKWVPSSMSVAGVLVDVPCSATGTGSKRPDVLRRNEDLGNLLDTQERLANHCVDAILSTGGILVYATCSVLKRESEDQVRKLLSRRDDDGNVTLETVPFLPGEIRGFDDAIDDSGWLRVLPGCLPGILSSCDGFFVARLRRL